MQVEEIAGRLDAQRVEQVELRCLALIRGLAEGDSLALDLRSTEFLASLGIRFLVAAARFAVQRKVSLLLVVPATGPVRETLDLAGLQNVLPLLESLPAD
ncbi:MAG: STAS domain-containing protein [Rhodocyclaceae bacterium]|nr:STAS domain-containing protein [Rhodocyclaceae bacterium]